ncbi:MAG: DUF222 domain-containing protein [Acidimicrobiia bacterium]
MELERLSEDQLDELLVRAEREIAGWRLAEMAVISEKRRRKSYQQDGYRSIVDWVAARADVSHETARSVCWTGSRLADAPGVAEELAEGEMTFDRAQQVARLPESHRAGHEGYDIAQLRRLVAHHRRLSPERETRAGHNGYLHLVSTSDQLMTALWGELPGLESRVVEKAIDQRADEIIPGDVRLAVAERRALALVAICQDSLYDPTVDAESSPVDVVVTVDARVAAPTDGEAGVSVLGGPRIGRRALEEILCHGVVEVIGVTADGEPLAMGRRTRTVGRKLRRFVLDRDGGCTADGCPSRYRLEAHHVVPWARNGKTESGNLVTLCWFHHHFSVHREGLEIVRDGPSRVRLKRPG